MLKLRRIAAGSLHLARMAPFSSSVANRGIATPRGDGASTANRRVATPPSEREKSRLFGKLECLISSETLDFLVKEGEKKGVSLTKEDLAEWAKQLNEDGKHGNALEIFEWMDKNKMEISAKDEILFVDLLAKIKGDTAAREFFSRIDPDPASFDKFMDWLRSRGRKGYSVRLL